MYTRGEPADAAPASSNLMQPTETGILRIPHSRRSFGANATSKLPPQGEGERLEPARFPRSPNFRIRTPFGIGSQGAASGLWRSG